LGEAFSEYYILGDYFDSFDKLFTTQYRNFADLCETVRQDGRIKLCLGNHDYHYLSGITEQRYSGFQDRNYDAINEILEANMDLLRVVYVTGDKYLISHAGVSAVFMKKMLKLGVTTAEGINEAFKADRNILTFDGMDISGDDVTQSPIWIRPRSLQRRPLAGYNQIIGHTPVRKIKEVTLSRGDTGGRIRLAYIDTGDRESIYRF
jgi:hypothetical protein